MRSVSDTSSCGDYPKSWRLALEIMSQRNLGFIPDDSDCDVNSNTSENEQGSESVVCIANVTPAMASNDSKAHTRPQISAALAGTRFIALFFIFGFKLIESLTWVYSRSWWLLRWMPFWMEFLRADSTPAECYGGWRFDERLVHASDGGWNELD